MGQLCPGGTEAYYCSIYCVHCKWAKENAKECLKNGTTECWVLSDEL